MMEYNNWVLNKYKDFIKPVINNFDPDYANFLILNGVFANVDLGLSRTFIDWGKYPGFFSFYYYFEGCESMVSQRLVNTGLSKYDVLLMDFGDDKPVFEIPVDVFIQNWLDFVTGARYLSTAATKDGRLIMEFVEGEFLNSNFKI